MDGWITFIRNRVKSNKNMDQNVSKSNKTSVIVESGSIGKNMVNELYSHFIPAGSEVDETPSMDSNQTNSVLNVSDSDSDVFIIDEVSSSSKGTTDEPTSSSLAESNTNLEYICVPNILTSDVSNQKPDESVQNLHSVAGSKNLQRYFTAQPYPPPKRAKKRVISEDQGDRPTKKQKTSIERTPTQLLNELHPGLHFVFSDVSIEKHDPLFEARVLFPVNGIEYCGAGRSKKLAKHNVSHQILVDCGYGNQILGSSEIELDVLKEVKQKSRNIKHCARDKQAYDYQINQSSPSTFPSEDNDESYALRTWKNSVFDPQSGDSEETFVPERATQVLHPPQQELDFTSDELPSFILPRCLPLALPNPFAPIILPLKPQLLKINFPQTCKKESEVVYSKDTIVKRLQKTGISESPVQSLNTLVGQNGNIKYNLSSESGPSHDRTFEYELTISTPKRLTDFQSSNEINVKGVGTSKKTAKTEASRLALLSILGHRLYNEIDKICNNYYQISGKFLNTKNNDSYASTNIEELEAENEEYTPSFSQQVANLITQKFQEITKDAHSYSSYKVLAGVVMTLGKPLLETMNVVSVTTGTKCIAGDYLSDKGLSVNDCHAEILATRCLRDFLFSQLEILREEIAQNANNNSKPNRNVDSLIFEQRKDSGQDILKVKLKAGVKFHLFINTAPCGDARIFSPNGLDTDEGSSAIDDSVSPPGELKDDHSNRQNRGLLRAKVEAGEGTIPCLNLTGLGPQTWDGILIGNSLRTMSCSDKLCRFNAIGLQGALLSSFMDPIYYSSIILGSLHHPVHFRRAIYGRLEDLQLTNPFSVHSPKLLMLADKMKRRVTKSPNYSVAWTCSWNAPEFIASTKGRCEPEAVASRLSKRLAFTRFLKLYNNPNGKKEDFLQVSYLQAKNVAESYQDSKKQFHDYLLEKGYGEWIKKPLEQDSFYIN